MENYFWRCAVEPNVRAGRARDPAPPPPLGLRVIKKKKKKYAGRGPPHPIPTRKKCLSIICRVFLLSENCLSIICTKNRLLLVRNEGFLVRKVTFGGVQSNRVFARDVPEILRDEDLREYFGKFGVSQSRNLTG